ncbi:MAG: D-aminoacylase [Chthonomonadales bacterium]|nr:D-aminoacylase [Chthonomonadales bacterium]
MDRYDLIIRNGCVIDGSGTPAFTADVGIRGDRIAAIGDLALAEASREIDADDRRVVPGFIDIHTHSDISVVFHPQMESMVSQGITTQVVGNCSVCIGLATPAPVFAFEQRWLAVHGARITWQTFAEHLRYVEDHGVGTNYVMLAGQGTLRKRVMGIDDRRPTAEELEAMKAELERALEAGAWGISTGLEYTPSGYADVSELAELSRVVARHGGFYATHLRNEGDRLIEAVREALEIGREGGIAVQLSHHKAEGRDNWGKVNQTLGMVDEARARGMDVQLDQYPYTAFQTSMAVQFLPPWANVGDNRTVLGRLTDPAQREAILHDIRANHADWDDLGPGSVWNGVVIGACRTNRALQGRNVGDMAREAGRHPIEMVLDLIVQERNFVSAVNFAIGEDDIATVMSHPWTMIGSDGVGTSPKGKTGEDRVHPRCYGTFPRVLGRYVRERGTLAEAAAIHKMTGLPARRLGLVERGHIAPGYFADLVVYDPATVEDAATFAHPHRFPAGIDLVLVNGVAAWEASAPTGALAGRVLRRTGRA